ncbi:MAG: argininosuccinate lyase [Clostridiales bacterium]|nr:argininosuccinate lyase [Clostridiales bacterium]
MRKQTKLVAVLSTAALLAIGASMTSFAAQGWAEEDGTWVYYNRDGERATDKWAKSGNNWYYLNSDGEMAVDTLIDDGDNYYYVDANGVMASNQWVAVENPDAGDDNEPDSYWYFFQANGKALTNGNNTGVSLKTINGKKYAFDSEGKMLYGWVNADNAERLDDANGDAFKEGDYFFGGSDDGALTVGWLQKDVTYDEASTDEVVAPVFNEDADQTRWFYFQANGKKVKGDANGQKEKTINGKKYAFDQYGAMVAEWSQNIKKASGNTATPGEGKDAQYSQTWRYFNSAEDGSRVSKGWFKVVPAKYLNEERYNDESSAWYYADGNGQLYAGEFKTINGKKYAFRNDGRMVDGLKFIKEANGGLDIAGDEDKYDNGANFDENAPELNKDGYLCYYFGNGEDGAMKTGKASVEIDGEKFNFYFETAGKNKGAGKTGEKDKKIYQSGKLLAAGKDEKYQVVKKEANGYKKYADADAFVKDEATEKKEFTATELSNLGINKKVGDVAELYVVKEASRDRLSLVNTSGKIVTNNGKNTDGNDYNYVIKNKKLVAVYVEN